MGQDQDEPLDIEAISLRASSAHDLSHWERLIDAQTNGVATAWASWAKDRDDDRKLRKDYGEKWFCIAAVQLIVMNVVFLISAFPTGPKFTDTTIQIYVGATCAQVFGVLLVIVGYLFPKQDAARGYPPIVQVPQHGESSGKD